MLRLIVDLLNGLVQEIIKDPEVIERYSDLGFDSTPEPWLDMLKFETGPWTKAVKDNGIEVDGQRQGPARFFSSESANGWRAPMRRRRVK